MLQCTHQLQDVQGTTLQIAYLDADGAEHHATIQMTETYGKVMGKREQIRQALEAYHLMTGGTLLSVQVMMESSQVVKDEHRVSARPADRGHVRLVATDGKRVYSPDVRYLAASLGKTPEAIFGDEP